jgi:3-hydroxybutyryl-CoA dehydrogenase
MTDFSKNKIALLGGGVMGRGIAQLAAQNSLSVCLFNRNEMTSLKSKQHIRSQLERAVEKGKLKSDELETVFERISFTTDLDELCEGVDFLIESLPEDLEIKKEAFKKISSKIPEHCIVCTNTSSLSVKELAEASGLPERFCGTHFFNPPVAMKLVEVVRHDVLADGVLKKVLALTEQLGRQAIEIQDSPGFATSRLSVCIGLEAVRMLEQGVGSAEDIDKAMELGYRHPMGPLKLGDYIGLDVRLKVAEHLYESLGSEVFKPPELLKNMVAEGKTGRKAGQGFYKW